MPTYVDSQIANYRQGVFNSVTLVTDTNNNPIRYLCPIRTHVLDVTNAVVDVTPILKSQIVRVWSSSPFHFKIVFDTDTDASVNDVPAQDEHFKIIFPGMTDTQQRNVRISVLGTTDSQKVYISEMV